MPPRIEDVATASTPVIDLTLSRDGRARRDETSTFSVEVERLYRADGARLWRAVYAYSSSRVVTDDAVAEAFAQLLRRGAAVDNPRAWVWRTAFRVAGGLLKERRRTVNQLVSDLTYEAPDDVLDLLELLKVLSGAQRAALVLHDYAGYRAREVADIIGSTEAAVRVHLMRARRRMRSRLTEA